MGWARAQFPPTTTSTLLFYCSRSGICLCAVRGAISAIARAPPSSSSPPRFTLSFSFAPPESSPPPSAVRRPDPGPILDFARPAGPRFGRQNPPPGFHEVTPP